MILVGHQPEYLPYLGFFQKVARADHFIIVDHVQYARKDFQNRNYIRNQGGKILLSVPVLSKGHYDTSINEIMINPTLPWPRKHWQSLYQSYKNAPFFAQYADELEAIYKKQWIKLSDLSIELINLMLKWLGIHVCVSLSSQLEINRKKTDMLIEMCQKIGADTYISGQGARDYVDLKLLEAAGLRHYFCRFENVPYYQFHRGFIPNLSAIDLLFNCGDGAMEILRRCIEVAPLEKE